MPADVPFPGFKYDSGKANAMADAIQALFQQAELTGPTTMDKLAALGVAAAVVILKSKIQRAPGQVATALATFITDTVTALARPT